jgi:outer membrane protein assembly factor BamB
MSGRRALPRLAAVASMAVVVVGSSAVSGAAPTTFWRSYLHDNQHSSYNAGATAITPSTVPGLTQAWSFHDPAVKGDPPPLIDASPTVYGGAVYVGSNTGMFYKLNEATGAVEWSVDTGHMPKATCRSKGIIGTAGVALDPTTNVLTVYVAGGDGNVDALRASNGSVIWKSPVDTNPPSTTAQYDFSSPMVADGHVYEGISSSCDSPLVRGGLAELDQHTGARLATYYTVPSGSVGGSIWSTPAITSDGSTIFVTTGNGDPTAGAAQGDSVSIVALDANTLAKKSIWTIPAADIGPDSDFGGSPTLFTATLNGVSTPMVGAENKNHVYYAWRQSNLDAGPVWQQNYGANQEVDAAAWAHGHLFLVNSKSNIGSVKYPSAIRELTPATGATVWAIGVPDTGLGFGSPTIDGGGVLAVPTYNATTGAANAYYLVNISTGALLRTFTLSGPSFPQAVFADTYLFITDGAQGAATLYAYH